MSLFWIVHEIDREPGVMIRADSALIFARMRATLDCFGGTFVEAHALDAKTAKKIPKAMIGRALTAREAAAVLDRLS